MSPPKKGKPRKSILDLALELGVRTDVVLQSMRDMGLSADESSRVDVDEEAALVDRMIEGGAISSSLSKGKGRRKLSEEPIVDDDLLTEALGASENGFSDANIPRQIQFESGFEKKSFFQKFFGKKKDIVSSLKDNPPDEDAVESMFAAPVARSADRELSPFQEIERQQTPIEAAPVDEAPKAPAKKKKAPAKAVEEIEQEIEEEIVADEEILSDDELEGVADESIEEDALDEELSAEDLEGIDLDIDESLLDNMEEIDVGGEEGLEDIAAEDLEDLGDISDEELEGVSMDDIDEEAFEGEEGEEDLDVSLDEDDLGEMDEEGGEFEDEDEEEYVPGYIEKFFARIHLTPSEMWALMIGSVVTMLLLLGVTVYWWMYASPSAMNTLLDEANAAYKKAVGSNEDPGGEIRLWQEGRIAWGRPKKTLTEAAELYAEYIKQFPDNPNELELAYKNMCDCYFQLAEGNKKSNDTEASESAYRSMAAFYEKFIELSEQIANINVGDSTNPELAYPSTEDRRLAMFRIAIAKRELQQFEQTIKSLEDFVARYPKSDDALAATIEIGDSYKIWAESKKDQELSLLKEASDAYRRALRIIPENDYKKRMNVFSRIGDVQYRLYERSKENDREDEADQHLTEVIANYVNGVSEAEKIDLEPLELLQRRSTVGEIQQVKKRLGDLYLIRGSQAGRQWREFEDRAEPFPDSILHKQQLLEAAKRERDDARHYLSQANSLYDNLLADSELLAATDYQDILYNKAQSFYIMREYPDAIAAGNQLKDTTRELNDDTKTKILYLLGNAAWEEAKETGDYTQVKEYYYDALKQDPFYPPEEKGDTSHLADIRLINAYYLSGEQKDYPEAIRRFEAMVKRYPESGYTYLTLYFYAETLLEYGDSIRAQVEKLREEAVGSTNANTLLAQARELQKKEREKYGDAVEIYERAKGARENSKYVDSVNERYLKDIMFNRAHSAFLEGTRYQEAEDFYLEALERYGSDRTAEHYKPLAIERLGDLNARLSAYDRAIQYYKQYLDNAYDNPDMRITQKLADAYLKRYSWDEARNWYSKIVKNDPNVPTENQVERRLRMGLPVTPSPGFNAMKKMAESHLSEAMTSDNREAKMKEALKAYADFAKKYPLNPDRKLPADAESLRIIGQIHYELQDYPDAVESYNAFLDMNPNFSRQGQILYKMGQAYIKMGKYDDAIARLTEITRESLDNDIQYADALILLAQAYQNKANEFEGGRRRNVVSLEYAARRNARTIGCRLPISPIKIREAAIMSNAIEDAQIRNRAAMAASTNP